jgi:hypothetical protein
VLHTAPFLFVRTGSYQQYSGADKSLVRPGRKQASVSVRMACISFGALPCSKRNSMPARVSMLLNSRASLTYFRVCFLPVRARDLSVPQYFAKSTNYEAPRYAIYSLPVTLPAQQQTPNAIHASYNTVTDPNALPAVSQSAHHSDCLANRRYSQPDAGLSRSAVTSTRDRRSENWRSLQNGGIHFSSSQHPERI